MCKPCWIAALLLTLSGNAAAEPIAPAALNATVLGDTVTLSWLHPEAGNIQFRLEAGTAPGLSNAAVLLTRAPSYTAVNVPAGVYYVRVRAIDITGAGPASAEVVVTVTSSTPTCTQPPDAPQGFAVDLTAQDGIDFDWRLPTGPCIPTGYLFQVGSQAGLTDLATLVVGPGFNFDYDVPTGVYYVRLVAINAFGASAPSNEVVVTYQRCLQPPSAPHLVAALDGHTVMLSWDPPSTGCRPSEYVIAAGTAAGRSDVGSVRVGNSLTFTGTIQPGTYYVRVFGVSPGGAGVASNEVRLDVR